MATISGTGNPDTITPAGVSAGVTGGTPSDAADTIAGLGAADSIDGGGGNDSLDGGAGDDTLLGHAGNDTLVPGSGGAESLDGGEGDDLLDLSGIASLIGLTLVGGAGTDTLDLFDGTVLLPSALPFQGIEIVDFSFTVLVGTAGKDHYDFAGIDAVGLDLEVHGGGGRDTIIGNAASGDRPAFFGGDGSDSLVGAGLTAFLSGEAGNDTLVNTADGGVLLGGRGADSLQGGDGQDFLDGGRGADTMAGGAGNDAYAVDDALDTIVEQADGGIDTVSAYVSWTLGANLEALVLFGGALDGTGNGGDNTITGTDGRNTLLGLGGQDSLDGGLGRDLLDGGTGADTLRGGAGSDTLIGGIGADLLRGEAGGDVFRYLSAAEGGDQIIGFDTAEDRFEVSAGGFGGGLVAGQALTNKQFVANTTGLATRAGMGQFVFDTDDGILWWDHDGLGGDAAVLIAVLSAGSTGMAKGDIAVIA